jgi:hypothetical protein
MSVTAASSVMRPSAATRRKPCDRTRARAASRVAKLGLWHTTALKETIYWFVGTGAVLAGNATNATPSRDYVKQIVGRLLRVTLVIEFIVNLYVFPLIAEIVLVFLVLAFTTMKVAAQYDSKIDALTQKVIDRVLVGIGVFLLVSFATGALSDLDGFLSRETAERFFAVPALTLAFIPFLYLVAWYSRWEQATIRNDCEPAEPGRRSYSARRGSLATDLAPRDA